MPAKPTPRSINQSDENVIEWIEHVQAHPEDEEIKAKIVEKYQQLVFSLARKFSKDSSTTDDLYQVGMIGLLSAIGRFDIEVGKSFVAFAIPTIVGEIKRYIRDKTWSVHVPRRIKELGPRIKKAVETLTNDLGGSPTIEDIANHLDVTEEEVLETMELGRSYQAVSMDSQMEADSEGGTMTLLDVIGRPDDGFEKVDDDLLLEKVFNALTEREVAIIKHLYFHHLSQKEAGERLGISQMHVSRLQRRALRKLRETLSTEQSGV